MAAVIPAKVRAASQPGVHAVTWSAVNSFDPSLLLAAAVYGPAAGWSKRNTSTGPAIPAAAMWMCDAVMLARPAAPIVRLYFTTGPSRVAVKLAVAPTSGATGAVVSW